jgi:hypothetical protein
VPEQESAAEKAKTEMSPLDGAREAQKCRERQGDRDKNVAAHTLHRIAVKTGERPSLTNALHK